jgi:hypothetical protein
LSATKNARRTATVTQPAPKAQTITLPTLSSIFAPTQSMNTANTGNCTCGKCTCCNQTSTTVCLTFDTSFLQSLVNMFPKINITNNSGCSDPNCDCDDESGQ